ncbi:hypothetical protein ACNRWW_05895 [Metabacillus sp. HB246100]
MSYAPFHYRSKIVFIEAKPLRKQSFLKIIKQQKNHANQYTFVWRKATEKYEKSLDDQYRQLALQIEQILDEEEESTPSAGLEEKLKETPITSEQIEHSIKKLEKHLETEPKNK